LTDVRRGSCARVTWSLFVQCQRGILRVPPKKARRLRDE
jgi:hypothetical protein